MIHCPNCGKPNILYLEIDNDLIPVEADRLHTVSLKHYNVVLKGGETHTISDINHIINCNPLGLINHPRKKEEK